MKTIKRLWRRWGIYCVIGRMRELDETERLCRVGIRVCIEERQKLTRELMQLERQNNA